MDVRQAYDNWADQYDTNDNKTRDLEAFALKDNLAHLVFDSCLEIGCGTGKNTVWLLSKSKEILAIDLSEEMLSRAIKKIKSGKVQFLQADINQPWTFLHQKYDLLVFSLVLEHIENLSAIFKMASNAIKPGGMVYLGELHPFKQYTGTKARFETDEGLQIVNCFNHHVSDFTVSAKKYGFELLDIKEYFDENNKQTVPRILTILFRKL
jgi:ubiquinone/menaquinone biosynthesis C-methylase UbiE